MFHAATPDTDPAIFPYVIVGIVALVIIVGLADVIRNAYLDWRDERRNRRHK